ncbi:MAG: electron transport complex subunit RsxC [Magnetococcales bacterium]|nr:electron transport complex subunit RsxC [Magnetococcales bacterium]
MGIVATILRKFHGGVHPKEYKELSRHCAIEELSTPPKQLYVPLHQHMGAPCDPCVEPGERVYKGQVIGIPSGFVSAPIHAPTSGTIQAIVEHVVAHPSGLTMPCAVLIPDGNDQWHPDLKGLDNPYTADPQAIRNKVREAGVVGLGGATFPSFIKLSPPDGKVAELLIINGVECEPYLTCDARVMEERSREIVEGIRIMLQALQTSRCIIAIENNKPGAIQSMSRAVEETPHIKVVALPVMYPQGAEKQLIEVVINRQVPSGGLPIDVGVIVHNVATATAVREAVLFGHPLIRRVVTVTGLGIPRPANLEVPIGTPVQALIDHCGGLKPGVKKVVMGGPMMGVALNDLQAPVVKGTSGLLVMLAKETFVEPEQPCIRCGSCLDVCPVELTPCEIAWRARHDLIDQLPEVHIMDCIECGSCAFACPAHIPLVHYFRYGKLALAAKKHDREKAELNRQRTKEKQLRADAEKAEKERKKEEMRLASEARKKAAAAAPKPAEPTPAPAQPPASTDKPATEESAP